MYLALVIKPDVLEFENGIPYGYEDDDDSVEIYTLLESLDSRVGFCRDFKEAIDPVCPNLLDLGDFDYFDSSRCPSLVKGIKKRLEKTCPQEWKVIYEKLLEFAKRAIVLRTGVLVEL